MRPSIRALLAWLKRSGFEPVHIPTHAEFPISDELERRRCMARETLKAAGKHIDRETDFTFGGALEEQPDTFLKPLAMPDDAWAPEIQPSAPGRSA